MWQVCVPRNYSAEQTRIGSFLSDKDAGITSHHLSNTWPLEMLGTVSFTEGNGKTIMTTTAIPINKTKEELATFEGAFESMQQGFSGTYEQLDTYLAKIQS